MPTDTAPATTATTATPQPFIHRPRPAIVPNKANDAWQRRFGASAETAYRLDLATDAPLRARAGVLRAADENTAILTVSLGLWTSAEIEVRLTPAELRELAARLIDAAADIEMLPVAELRALAEAAKALATREASA